METGTQRRTSSSLPVIGLLLLVAGAFYISRSPLESSRPDAPSGLENAVPERHKIDARLWQDPLKVAMDHKKTAHSVVTNQTGKDTSTCSSKHYVNQVSKRILAYPKKDSVDGDPPTVQVLLTIVRDGTFAEDHERRLRNRYAMLSALHLSGFTPEDSEHIQYFKLAWTAEKELESRILNDAVPKIGTVPCDKSETVIVPFEWLRREGLYPRAGAEPSAKDPGEYVVVIWLPEGAFSHRPLTRLAQVIDAVGYKANSDVKIDVIGPSYSGTLRTMIDEIEDVNDLCKQSANNDDMKCGRRSVVDVNSMLDKLTIFSPWSTASPALLVRDWPPLPDSNQYSELSLYEVIPKRFNDIGVTFIRTIGSDDLLAKALIDELRRRGMDLIGEGEKDHVDLISEWDTFYGKVFPLTFATMVECMETVDPKGFNWIEYARKLHDKMADRGHNSPYNVDVHSYIRGVDGKLPGAKSAKEKESGGREESESKWVYNKSLELPIGKSQLDYVRRLVRRIDDAHKPEWFSSRTERTAIGVVGSDVYDKLILLHALREQLSGAVLFMTDLDARLMHNEQFNWTRNVIVASNFGLRLHNNYQWEAEGPQGGSQAPPFRDNYQTALFLACRIALGLRTPKGKVFLEMDEKELTKMISQPRLFEIGRGRAVDLSAPISNDRNKEERAYIQIHPEPHNRFPGWGLFGLNLILILIVVLICVYLLVQLSLTLHTAVLSLLVSLRSAPSILIAACKRCDSPNKPKAKPEPGQSVATNYMVILSVAIVIAFIAVVIIDHYRPGGERFSFVAGTSVWPGSALRLLAIILSAFLLTKAAHDIQAGDRDLCKWFDPQEPGELMLSTISYRKWRERENLSAWTKPPLHPYTWWRYRRRIGISNWKTDDEFAEAGRLWEGYLDRGTFGNRVHRLILPTLLFWILLLVLCWYFGRPNTPYRGWLSSAVDAILAFFCVFSMIFLMFFVVDATRLCLRPIHAMIRYPNWHEELIDSRKRNSTITLCDNENWLDVQFIAQLTDSVGKLIYYPFVIIAIMIAARWRYFDNWDWPISLIIVYMMCSFYMISCVVRLQLAAKKARQKAIDKLQTTLDRIRFVDSKRSEQIEYLIGRIESVRQGAFTPFFENPVVHVLIPSGGMSLLALLRFFPLS